MQRVVDKFLRFATLNLTEPEGKGNFVVSINDGLEVQRARIRTGELNRLLRKQHVPLTVNDAEMGGFRFRYHPITNRLQLQAQEVNIDVTPDVKRVVEKKWRKTEAKLHQSWTRSATGQVFKSCGGYEGSSVQTQCHHQNHSEYKLPYPVYYPYDYHSSNAFHQYPVQSHVRHDPNNVTILSPTQHGTSMAVPNNEPEYIFESLSEEEIRGMIARGCQVVKLSSEDEPLSEVDIVYRHSKSQDPRRASKKDRGKGGRRKRKDRLRRNTVKSTVKSKVVPMEAERHKSLSSPSVSQDDVEPGLHAPVSPLKHFVQSTSTCASVTCSPTRERVENVPISTTMQRESPNYSKIQPRVTVTDHTIGVRRVPSSEILTAEYQYTNGSSTSEKPFKRISPNHWRNPSTGTEVKTWRTDDLI